MAWAKNGTPDTLGSAGDTLQITDLTAYKFNLFMFHEIESTANNANERLTFNNNSNTVYAERKSSSGAADATNTSQAYANLGANSHDEFGICHTVSISGEEKLAIYFGVGRQTAGAANAPERVEQVFKFVPSPDADITRIDINNTDTGDYDTGSNLSALGTD